MDFWHMLDHSTYTSLLLCSKSKGFLFIQRGLTQFLGIFIIKKYISKLTSDVVYCVLEAEIRGQYIDSKSNISSRKDLVLNDCLLPSQIQQNFVIISFWQPIFALFEKWSLWNWKRCQKSHWKQKFGGRSLYSFVPFFQLLP